MPVNNALVLLILLVIAGSNKRFQAQIKQRLLAMVQNPRVSGAAFGTAIVIAGAAITYQYRNHEFVSSILGLKPLPTIRVNVRELTPSGQSQFPVLFQNKSQFPIKFLGNQSSCQCLVGKLPEEPVLPGGQVELEVVVLPRKPGVFHQRIVCFVDHPEQTCFAVDVLGHVSSKEFRP